MMANKFFLSFVSKISCTKSESLSFLARAAWNNILKEVLHSFGVLNRLGSKSKHIDMSLGRIFDGKFISCSKVICKLLLDIFKNQVSKSSWLGSYASWYSIRKVVFTLCWRGLIHFTPIFSKLQQEMGCQLDVAVLYNDCWSSFCVLIVLNEE